MQVVVQVRNPLPVRKRLRGQTNTARSPFNMHLQSPFLNYWNCQQTFYLRGHCDRHDFAMMLNTLRSVNPTVKIEQELPVKFLKKQEIVEVGKSLNSRAYKFGTLMDQLRLPMRYAIMSLLSLYKVSIFNETLVKFVNCLACDQKWNSDKYAEYGAYLIDQMS